MRKLLFNLGILSVSVMSLVLVSCGGDDDDDDFPGGSDNPVYSANVDKVLPMGRPTEAGYLSSLVYDSTGRLVSCCYSGDEGETIKVVEYGADRVIVENTWKEEGHTYSNTTEFKIGSNGYVDSFTLNYPGEEPTIFKFNYDNDGHLIKLSHSNSDYANTRTIVYDNSGDIIRIEDTTDDYYYHTKYSSVYNISYINETVTSKIENKSGIMLFDECYNLDLANLSAAYYAGLLGKGTAHLPVALSVKDGEYNYTRMFTWSIADDGRPSSMSITDSFGNNGLLYIKW